MTTEEATKYDARRERIARISALLGKIKADSLSADSDVENR